jgi:NADH-quinone oxidoreductase subunit L
LLLYRDETFKKWLAPLFHDHGHHEELLPPIVVSALALTMVAIGVAIALMKYSFKEVAAEAPSNVSWATRFVRNDLGQDTLNETLFMKPGQVITRGLVAMDETVIDGAVRGVGSMAIESGSTLRRTQTGYVRAYAALIFVGALALLTAIWVVTQ